VGGASPQAWRIAATDEFGWPPAFHLTTGRTRSTGAGGGIGSGVARTFAREGAAVFLAGRTEGPMEAVAADIRAAGGTAEVAVLDATDERAVDSHVEDVAAQVDTVDVSFNLISRPGR
jgi:short-subunit dehydrogenase